MTFTDRPGIPRRIVGFHTNDEQHWVADLECGHTQHVRHDPPWQVREWVTTRDGRATRIGQTLICVKCVEGGRVVSVSRSGSHSFSKSPHDSVRLIEGEGVEGDAHRGTTVKHRSRVARNPSEPNLRQVHLIHAELFEELRALGFEVAAGEMGENITTSGIDLLALPAGTRLHLGDTAIVEVTGLRNPCVQIDRFQSGLLSAVATRDDSGHIIRKTGVMSVVIAGGDVKPGDEVRIELPSEPHRRLDVV